MNNPFYKGTAKDLRKAREARIADRTDAYIGTYFRDSQSDMDELAKIRVLNKKLNQSLKSKGVRQVLKAHGRGKNRFERSKEYYRAKYPGITDKKIRWMCAQCLPISCAKYVDVYLYQYQI
tara:strand:- start:549 stop:911 length:363 start_codon:yes stop_codon:yes gene_type:complete